MKWKWILLTLLAFIAAVFLYLKLRKSKDFEPLIKEKLAQLVTNATNGLYQLDVSQIEIDITNGSVHAKNILLLPDSLKAAQLRSKQQLGENLFYVSVKQINLGGLSPLDLLDKKNISIDQLVIDSPEIKVVHSTPGNTVAEKDTAAFEKVINDGQSLQVGMLQLNNIRLTLENRNRNKTVSSFQNLSAVFTDIRIDSSTQFDSSRFLFARDAVLYMRGFSQQTAKNKYSFTIDSAALKPQHGTLQLFDVRLKPVGSKDEFMAKLAHAEDMFDIHVPGTIIRGINWFDLLSNEGLKGNTVKMDNGVIKMYHDRRLPGGGIKTGNFPHQLLMKAELPLYFRQISLHDFFISYEEFNPKSEHAGTVAFHHLSGDISQLTNIPDSIARYRVARINATTDFMNAGKLDARFELDLVNAEKGNFSVDADLGAMDGSYLNKITEGLAQVRIKSLQVEKLKAHIDADNRKATGTLVFNYRDLSIEILKNTDDGTMQKRGLISFITNTLVVKNKSNGKAYPIMHERDPRRSFFNHIWKTILDGILKTVK